MKIYIAVSILALSPLTTFAARLIPSTLDPAMAKAREEAFIPWCTPKEKDPYWKKLSPNHVPIYYERKAGDLSRDIFTPNPGIGYWVLAGLTEKELLKTQRAKLKIDDTLVSASVYQDENGTKIYWALWAPRGRAHLLLDRMKALGIGQARIEYSLIDKFGFWAESLNPVAGVIAVISLALSLLLLFVTLFFGYLLMYKQQKK